MSTHRDFYCTLQWEILGIVRPAVTRMFWGGNGLMDFVLWQTRLNQDSLLNVIAEEQSANSCFYEPATYLHSEFLETLVIQARPKYLTGITNSDHVMSGSNDAALKSQS